MGLELFPWLVGGYAERTPLRSDWDKLGRWKDGGEGRLNSPGGGIPDPTKEGGEEDGREGEDEAKEEEKGWRKGDES